MPLCGAGRATPDILNVYGAKSSNNHWYRFGKDFQLFLDKSEIGLYTIEVCFRILKECNMDITEWCKQYNQIYNEYSELYHALALNCGISDSQYWLIYTVYTSKSIVTQNDLAKLLGSPKQTINSAVSRLLSRNYVKLEQCSGAGNLKSVELTEQGRRFCEKYIDPVLKAEEKAMSKFSDFELKAFLQLSVKRLENIKEEVSIVLGETNKK